MNTISDWVHIENRLPMPEHSVLVGKLTEDNTMLTGVGRLILTNDHNGAGWLCTEDGNFRAITARPYWMPLMEEKIVLPTNLTDDKLSDLLLLYLNKLSCFEDKFKALAAAMMQAGNGLYPIDFYISGVVTRSLSLIFGFDTLIKSKNYLSAAHLVRTLLDNYLRLSALWLVTEPHKIATQVWEGTPINKIADRDGKKMTDSYLRDKAAETYPWITNVYNETSGFIHFSNKHIMNATVPHKNKKMTMVTYFGKFDHEVTNESRIEATACMIEICNCICHAIFGWVDTKRLEKMQ
ncbi:hypothetical protein [Paraflavitalea soli]|nr:hypothetical protein [Paraflavitalea soli]